jgi:WD40 repeat protein
MLAAHLTFSGAVIYESILAYRALVSQVRGLEFSPLAPNLLASGGDDGDLYIWDLKTPTAPTRYPPLRPMRVTATKPCSTASYGYLVATKPVEMHFNDTVSII